jgi:hypothetical protein
MKIAARIISKSIILILLDLCHDNTKSSPSAQDMYPHCVFFKLFKCLEQVNHFESQGVCPHYQHFIHHGLCKEPVPTAEQVVKDLIVN